MLKAVALEAGLDANFLVLPWEPVPDAPGEKVWDGYFPWIWLDQLPVPADQCWTMATTREKYLQRLRDYYSMAQRVKSAGQIEHYIGAVCPGFDDHKGQAWGEGQRRHLPSDNGQTFRQTWDELRNRMSIPH